MSNDIDLSEETEELLEALNVRHYHCNRLTSHPVSLDPGDRMDMFEITLTIEDNEAGRELVSKLRDQINHPSLP